MGKAIVSTPLGVEGIDVVDGREVLVGEHAEALVGRLALALENGDLVRRLGDAALARARARYSWRASAARLAEFHAELARTRVDP